MKTIGILRIVILLFLFQSADSNAWDTKAAKYYPLNIGNVYVFYKYELRFGCYPQTFQQKSRVHISGLETKPNGKQYYRFSGWWNDQHLRANPFLNLQRIDSNSMNVYVYDSVSNTEFLIDSLLANVTNRFDCNRLTSVMPNGIYDLSRQAFFLDSLRTIKEFQCSPTLVSHHYKLAEGIGFSEITSCEIGAGTGYFLKGCAINGSVYGDTSFINVEDYFPLRVGNVWSYSWIYNGNPAAGGLVNIYVTRDTLLLSNSRRYFLCLFPNSARWLRIDQLSGNIYEYSMNGGCSYHQGEVLVDSLFSGKGDSTNFCSSVRRICRDTGNVQLFGLTFHKKNFGPLFALTASGRNYAKNIGLYFYNEGEPFTTDYTLRGCYINGVLYGDTTLTSLTESENSAPHNFFLSQNYPNPFNPKTIINYELGIRNFVSLKVLDIAGKEVATLVNKIMPAGNHYVEFNAADLSSGIYFCVMRTGGYQKSIRIAVVK